MIEYRVKIFENGNKFWLLNEDLHFIEYANGDRVWFRNGRYHREDGPAIERANGYYKSWWLNGMRLSEQEFLRRTSPPELQVIKDLRVVAKNHGYKLTKEGE